MSGEQIQLGDLSDMREGQIRVFADHGPHGVVVCRVAGDLYAVEDNCSHRDAQLSGGRMRGGLLTCPLHGSQFDVRTGEPQAPPATQPIACYPIAESDVGATLQLDS